MNETVENDRLLLEQVVFEEPTEDYSIEMNKKRQSFRNSFQRYIAHQDMNFKDFIYDIVE